MAWLPGDVLRLSTRPGTQVTPVHLDDPAHLPATLATWAAGGGYTAGGYTASASAAGAHTAAEFRLDLDLGAPAPAELEPVDFEVPVQATTLHPSLAELATVVVAGPGVVRHGQADALARFAAEAGVGVATSWGAAGVLGEGNPHHLGTVGLQARDLDLAGVVGAELVITVGLDEDETPHHMFMDGASMVLDVDPRSLDSLAYQWSAHERVPAASPLRTGLAGLLAAHGAAEGVPLDPARAVRELRGVVAPGSLVAADPGPAGLWLARALPTTGSTSVVVPATGAPGVAAALAVVAARQGHPALAVTVDPLAPVTEAVLALAPTDTPVVVVRWGGEDRLDPAYHGRALRDALEHPGVHQVAVAVDLAQTRALVDLAGPVVAWGAGGDP